MIVKIFKKECGHFIDVVATHYEEKRKNEIISTIDDTVIDKFIQKYDLSTSEEEF